MMLHLANAFEIGNPHSRGLIVELEKITSKSFRWSYHFRKFENISSEMEFNKEWPALISRRQDKIRILSVNILSHQLRVDYASFIIINSSYNKI